MTKTSSLSLIPLIMMLGGCAASPDYYYNRIEGTIKEKTTSSPVAGAVVLVRWEVASGTHSQSWTCTWIDAAESDAQGRFSIVVQPSNMINRNNSFKREMKGGWPQVLIFKSGMVTTGRGYDDGVTTRDDAAAMQGSTDAFFLSSKPVLVTTVVDGTLRKSTSDSHDRIRELFMRSKPQHYCADHVSPGPAKRYYEAMANEAHTIASGAYEKALADLISKHAQSPISANGWSSPAEEALPVIAFDPNIGNDNRDERDHTPLMRAAARRDAGKVEQLLRGGRQAQPRDFRARDRADHGD